ncbi:hypothetical protein JCM19297_3437 [Nonlabens ulvanivorans]|nr:hypothetical protein JCM19297_3437 [Nonlabens ulvanivorans]
MNALTDGHGCLNYNKNWTLEDPQGQELAQILKPLSDVVIERYTDYLPKLNYAIRVGEHSNTAFDGICLGLCHTCW